LEPRAVARIVAAEKPCPQLVVSFVSDVHQRRVDFDPSPGSLCMVNTSQIPILTPAPTTSPGSIPTKNHVTRAALGPTVRAVAATHRFPKATNGPPSNQPTSGSRHSTINQEANVSVPWTKSTQMLNSPPSVAIPEN